MTGEKDTFKQFNVSQLIHSTPSEESAPQTSDPTSANSKSEPGTADNKKQKTPDNTCNLERYFDLMQAMLLGKSGSFLTLHSLFRTCLDLSLAQSLQMKGRQRRDLSLENLTIHEVQFKGSINNVIVVDSINTKALCNRYFGFVRHFRTELCLQFSLSLYLFTRFHVPDDMGKLDLSPDIFNDPNCLRVKLMNGGQIFRSLSYSQQYKAWSKVSKDMGDFGPSMLGQIVASKQNHNPALGSVGTKQCPSSSISLPIKKPDMESLCKAAGFESASAYYIARAQKLPPQELVAQIFPFVDSTMPSLSLRPFFKVLRALRISLIQDMVEMKASYPNEYLSVHPLFESRAFYEYFCLVRREIIIPPDISPPFECPPLKTASFHKNEIQPIETTQKVSHLQKIDARNDIPEHKHLGAKRTEGESPDLCYRIERLEKTIEDILQSVTMLEDKMEIFARASHASERETLNNPS